MKMRFILVMGLLAALAACTPANVDPGRAVPNKGDSSGSTEGEKTSGGTGVTEVAPTLVNSTFAPGNKGVETPGSSEEAEIKFVVEAFGKQLQYVSLLSPEAAQEMEKHYSEFISPTLLKTWTSDVSTAPGRIVSSPWPDRIEIAQIMEEGSDRSAVSGYVVQVSISEVVGGGQPIRIPVQLTVQKIEGRWIITEYAER